MKLNVTEIVKTAKGLGIEGTDVTQAIAGEVATRLEGASRTLFTPSTDHYGPSPYHHVTNEDADRYQDVNAQQILARIVASFGGATTKFIDGVATTITDVAAPSHSEQRKRGASRLAISLLVLAISVGGSIQYGPPLLSKFLPQSNPETSSLETHDLGTHGNRIPGIQSVSGKLGEKLDIPPGATILKSSAQPNNTVRVFFRPVE